MRVIHLCRKPLGEGTVAANVLEHGTGGVNIDKSRVAAGADHGNRAAVESHWRLNNSPRQSVEASPLGRWPSNVILQHLEGCRCEGTRQIPSNDRPNHAIKDRSATRGEGYGLQGPSLRPAHGENGKEDVAVWDCEPGCPVANLDRQGEMFGAHPAGSARGPGGWDSDGGWGFIGQGDSGGARIGDSGGVSRFYKQVGGKE